MERVEDKNRRRSSGDNLILIHCREKVMKHLEEHGFAVIPNVISPEECDKFTEEYMEWWAKFGDDKPYSTHSLIQTYHIGHFETTWNIRLKAKPVFAEIWQTEKLLTSFDAIALGQPPEISKDRTRDPDQNWFHVDQGAKRKGLHAFQGAVYLEETTISDWCFRVLKGSHKCFEEFYEEHPGAALHTVDMEFYKLKRAEKKWYFDKGCMPTLVPCPKGGIVLWDSRTIHDNARPMSDRANPDRWRVVAFVCMTPAKWSKMKDKHVKTKAFKSMNTSTHWPSQGVDTFNEFIPPQHEKYDVTLKSLPDVALTEEVKLLAGVQDYDFDDGEPNGPPEPEWEF